MTYKRVTAEERTLIYRWRREGRKQSEIARRLDRNPGSISREITRNRGRRGYRPKQAHEKAQAQAKRAGPRRFTALADERGLRGGRGCVRKRSTRTSTPTPRLAGRCGRTFPEPSVSGGGDVPVKMAVGEDKSQTSEGSTPVQPRWRRA